MSTSLDAIISVVIIACHIIRHCDSHDIIIIYSAIIYEYDNSQ